MIGVTIRSSRVTGVVLMADCLAGCSTRGDCLGFAGNQSSEDKHRSGLHNGDTKWKIICVKCFANKKRITCDIRTVCGCW